MKYIKVKKVNYRNLLTKRKIKILKLELEILKSIKFYNSM